MLIHYEFHIQLTSSCPFCSFIASPSMPEHHQSLKLYVLNSYSYHLPIRQLPIFEIAGLSSFESTSGSPAKSENGSMKNGGWSEWKKYGVTLKCALLSNIYIYILDIYTQKNTNNQVETR